MGLMSSLYVGASGLQVSQNALNTTSHNLANVETNGYVRQQTVLKDSQYLTVGQSHISAMQTGLGVDTQIVRQVRDMFLDQSYRAEVGRQGFYDSQYETVSEIEGLLGELNGVAFQNTIEDFWGNLQELVKEPDNLVKRASLIQTSVSFIERSEKIYKQLSEYQTSLNTKVQSSVDRINQIGNRVVELNDKISFYESSGVEQANDLRDERNGLLDELGQIIKITYRENVDGRVTVNAEGMPFVTEDTCMQMGTMTVSDLRRQEMGDDAFFADVEGTLENTEMLIPIWNDYGNCEVFNRDLIPSSAQNTDIGGLKGLLLARGTKVGKYIDIPIAPEERDYKDSTGTLDEKAFKAAMSEYEEKVEEYNRKINPSIIMSAQAQFDQLIHGITTTINNILSPLKEVTIKAGSTVTRSDGTTYEYKEDTIIHILDTENAPVGQDGVPATMGEELFSRKSVDRYMKEQDITLADGTVIKNARIYNEESKGDNYSLYTVGELKVNQELVENQSKLPLSENSNTGDYSIKTTQALIDQWNASFATIDPNTLTKSNFNDYYNCFIGTIATKGEKMKTIAESQQGMVQSIESQRSNMMGVSSDEELTNMIKFQHAYNAAARYINVIDEMLEHLVTRL